MAKVVTFEQWNSASTEERGNLLKLGCYMEPEESLKLAQHRHSLGQITDDQLVDEIAFYAGTLT